MNIISLKKTSFAFVYFVLSIFVFIPNQNVYSSLAFSLETSTVSSFSTNTNAFTTTQETSEYLETTIANQYLTDVTKTTYSETTTFDHTDALSITSSTVFQSIKDTDTIPTTPSYFNETTTSESIKNFSHTSFSQIENETDPFNLALLNNSSDDLDNVKTNLKANDTKDQNQTLDERRVDNKSDNDLELLVEKNINETYENSTTSDISTSSQMSTSYVTFSTSQTIPYTTLSIFTTSELSTLTSTTPSQADIYNNFTTIIHQNITSGIFITTTAQTSATTSSAITYITTEVTNSTKDNRTLTSHQRLSNETYKEKLEEDKTPVIAGATVGAVLLLLLIIGLIVMFYCIAVSRKATGRYNPKKEEEGGVVDGGLHFDILQLPIEEKLI